MKIKSRRKEKTTIIMKLSKDEAIWVHHALCKLIRNLEKTNAGKPMCMTMIKGLKDTLDKLL